MRRHRPNFALLIGILVLIIVGSILISSASVVMSKQISGDPGYYFKQHIVSLLLGFALMFFAYKVDYNFWKKLSPLAIVTAVILMILVFVPGIGAAHGTFANRWINIGPINFAPTEVFKFSLIIYLAAWFEKKGSEIKSFAYSAVPFLFIMAVSAALIIAQPDMGTLMVVALVAGVMYFVAGASVSHILGMIMIAASGIVYLIVTAPYRMKRFMIFLNPSADQSGAGYQINQALLAIGTGGLFGVGYGQSRQKFNYLPEAASDSIFAVASEELGFIGASLLVLTYLVVAYQGYKVAEKAPDGFSRLIAAGITSWIVIQAMINIGALLSIIPLTGIPLPFISLGSSSTVMLMLASGILLNISTHTQGETRESRSLRRRHWWTYFTGASRY